MKNFIVLFFVTIATLPLFAKIEMPKIFSDNMLLQRDCPVKIWGKSDSNADIEVSFKEQKVKTKADSNGKWSVELKALKASKTPEEMIIFENGKEGTRIKNILVGEVWIAGGQSNMELSLWECTTLKAVQSRADYPNLRYFKMVTDKVSRTEQEDCPEGSKWLVCSPKNVAGFSGAAFHFAEKLMQDLDVPVGIVYASRGATEMAVWIPKKNMGRSPLLKEYSDKFFKEVEAYTEADYKKQLEAYNKRTLNHNKKVAEAKASNRPIPTRPWDDLPPIKESPRKFYRSPSFLYNSLIAPIGGYAAKGVIWYQGESDAHPSRIIDFENRFKILIDSWRELWKNDQLHFLYVQLASWGHNGNQNGGEWPRARKAQTNCLKFKNVGMANIIDTGLEKNIHPDDKETVGLRLEKLALRQVYGVKSAHPYCPMFKSARYFSDRVEIDFRKFGRGLVAKGEPRGFEILLKSGKWIPAKARFVRHYVVVENPDRDSEEEIIGVRYLWKNWALPEVWLFNKDGLPLNSFEDTVK